MSKFKMFHDCLEYVENHDDVIIKESDGMEYGYPKFKFGIVVSGHMIVCPTCGGTGSHDRRDLDCSLLVDSMREDGDYEGIENYMNGAFSETCRECNGKNVVMEANYETVPEWAQKAIQEWEDSARESAIIEDAERRAGC